MMDSIIGVGTNLNFGARWQSPDKPSPTITNGVNALNSHYFKVVHDTDISRFAIGKEFDKLKAGKPSKRYPSLTKPSLTKPSPTILASHGNFSTAGVTHPTERRKFTIAELRRICAFPDDFVLLGTYAQQWERLGNSVPPVIMKHIAEAVRDGVLLRPEAKRAQLSTGKAKRPTKAKAAPTAVAG